MFYVLVYFSLNLRVSSNVLSRAFSHVPACCSPVDCPPYFLLPTAPSRHPWQGEAQAVLGLRQAASRNHLANSWKKQAQGLPRASPFCPPLPLSLPFLPHLPPPPSCCLVKHVSASVVLFPHAKAGGITTLQTSNRG